MSHGILLLNEKSLRGTQQRIVTDKRMHALLFR